MYGDFTRRLAACEEALAAMRGAVQLQLATQQADYLNAYEKVLAVNRKMVARLASAAEAADSPTKVDRAFRKAQIRARRLGKVAGGNGVPETR